MTFALPHLANSRVLVVEDDPRVAQATCMFLQMLSCRVECATDGVEALSRAMSGHYDLILLDVSLPHIDGVSVCRRIRQQGIATPIIMLTAHASEGDKVLGLSAGADDYVTKPFSPPELQARLAALLRRANGYTESAAPQVLEFGALRIDVARRAVTVATDQVVLTAREFDLLLALARHPGRVYTREQLLDAVWGYKHEGYGHTVNSHINRLRAKIEPDPTHPQYVLTVWGVGYKFLDR